LGRGDVIALDMGRAALDSQPGAARPTQPGAGCLHMNICITMGGGEGRHDRRGDGGATLGSLGFALQGALQCLIEGGFRFFVLLLTNETLLVFDFEFEKFFFQAFEQL